MVGLSFGTGFRLLLLVVLPLIFVVGGFGGDSAVLDFALACSQKHLAFPCQWLVVLQHVLVVCPGLGEIVAHSLACCL